MLTGARKKIKISRLDSKGLKLGKADKRIISQIMVRYKGVLGQANNLVIPLIETKLLVIMKGLKLMMKICSRIIAMTNIKNSKSKMNSQIKNKGRIRSQTETSINMSPSMS